MRLREVKSAAQTHTATQEVAELGFKPSLPDSLKAQRPRALTLVLEGDGRGSEVAETEQRQGREGLGWLEVG